MTSFKQEAETKDSDKTPQTGSTNCRLNDQLEPRAIKQRLTHKTPQTGNYQ